MAEYQAPTLDKILGGTGTGLGLATTAVSAMGKVAASQLMGPMMAAFLSNPFTAVGAALLPLASMMFGPGSDGPKMVGATNIVEPYDKLLTQRRDDFLKNSANATPEQKLKFAAEQEAIIQEMFSIFEKNKEQLGDIGARSVAERQPGGKHDFYKYYVTPITGGGRAADFAQANGLQMPQISGVGTPGGGGLNLTQRVMGSPSGALGTGASGPLNLGGGSAANWALPAAAGGATMFSGIGSWLGNLFGNQGFQQAMGALAPAITGILGGLGQRSSNDAANATLQGAIADLLGRGDEFANLSAEQQAQVVQAVQQMLGAGGATPQFSALQSDIARTGSSMPALFGQNLADPQAINMLLQSIADPRAQGAMTQGANMVASNGMTPELAQLFQTAQAFQTGSSGQQMQLQSLANELTQNGGVTPFLQTLMGAGSNALATRGMTPEIQQALGPFMSLLQSGGKNAENTALFNRGMDLFNREALLPMSKVIGIAGDQAGRAVLDQYEQVRREAQQRGGGPGAVVGSGSANDARAEFGDRAAAAIAKAQQDAMMGQQGLQLQQQATGAGAAGQGASLMAQLLGMGQSGVSNLLSTAAGREGTLGQLGAAGQQQANQRTGMGGDFLNTIMQIALGGGQLGASGVGQQTGRINAGGNIVQGMGQLQQSGLDSIVKNLLQGSQLGIQQGTALGNLLNTNQELLSRNEIGRMSNINSLLSLLTQMSGQNLSTASGAYTSSAGLQSPLATGQRNSPLSDALTAVGPGLAQWINSTVRTPGIVPTPNATVAPYVTSLPKLPGFNPTS